MIQQMMMTLQMASTVALHLLSQLDARHGHHPVQGLQQGDDDVVVVVVVVVVLPLSLNCSPSAETATR